MAVQTIKVNAQNRMVQLSDVLFMGEYGVSWDGFSERIGLPSDRGNDLKRWASFYNAKWVAVQALSYAKEMINVPYIPPNHTLVEVKYPAGGHPIWELETTRQVKDEVPTTVSNFSTSLKTYPHFFYEHRVQSGDTWASIAKGIENYVNSKENRDRYPELIGYPVDPGQVASYAVASYFYFTKEPSENLLAPGVVLYIPLFPELFDFSQGQPTPEETNPLFGPSLEQNQGLENFKRQLIEKHLGPVLKNYNLLQAELEKLPSDVMGLPTQPIREIYIGLLTHVGGKISQQLNYFEMGHALGSNHSFAANVAISNPENFFGPGSLMQSAIDRDIRVLVSQSISKMHVVVNEDEGEWQHWDIHQVWSTYKQFLQVAPGLSKVTVWDLYAGSDGDFAVQLAGFLSTSFLPRIYYSPDGIIGGRTGANKAQVKTHTPKGYPVSESAVKHGVKLDDMDAAIQNPGRVFQQENGALVYVQSTKGGSLSVVINENGVIVHANVEPSKLIDRHAVTWGWDLIYDKVDALLDPKHPLPPPPPTYKPD
jgi:hypothetical protein